MYKVVITLKGANQNITSTIDKDTSQKDKTETFEYDCPYQKVMQSYLLPYLSALTYKGIQVEGYKITEITE